MATRYLHVGMRFVDERNEHISVPLYGDVSDAITLAALISDAVTKIGVVANMSDCGLLKAWISLGVPVTPTSPAVGSQIERTGLVTTTYGLDGARTYGFDIPSFVEAAIWPGTKKIDPTNLGFQALQNMLLETDGPIYPGTPDGLRILSVPGGRLTFRKHRRIANRS